MRRPHRNNGVGPIYTFIITWLVLSAAFPLYELWGFGLCLVLAFLAGKIYASSKAKKAEKKAEVKKAAAPQQPLKKSYGPEIDPIIEEGHRALGELGKLYSSIDDTEIRKKINEIMRITDKIVQDAIDDPSDIPQIKKFLNYYIPTTIKLLNAYDRMGAQGIQGENIDKSMKSINEMLDVAIEAYRKRLDSLFENQALDIETDIDVMNTMLAREGLAGEEGLKATK